MGYIVVTSNTQGVIFDLGVYGGALGFSKFLRAKSTVQTVAMKTNWIEYSTSDGKTFAISYQVEPSFPNVMKVDSVNGTPPDNLSHLFDLLVGVLA